MKVRVTVFLLVCFVHGKCDEILKSSLTFVIDNSNSMIKEIDAVKDVVIDIFDTVIKSASHIENIIVITFNDDEKPVKKAGKVMYTPDRVKLLASTTKNVTKKEFTRLLNSTKVGGGGDCPEYAMAGIKLALEKSLRGSYIFVFTDAGPKDHGQYEIVKNLVIKLQSQIFFVLTKSSLARCVLPAYDYTHTETNVQVYHNLANATSGAVFHLEKEEVKQLLEYVKVLVVKRQLVLTSKTFPPGYGHIVNVTVDSKINETVFVLIGMKSYINVTGPNGSLVTDQIVNTTYISIVSAKIKKSGVHIVEVGSETNTSLTISGVTNVYFNHGFSVLPPSSISDTTTKPLPDTKLILSIKLIGDGVKLTTANILDMHERMVMEIPLEIKNDTQKFYLTKPFRPPNIMFKIQVAGYIIKDNVTITRMSLPVELQNFAYEVVEYSKPTLTIDREPKVTLEYDELLELKCKVDGYPPPKIFWEENGIGVVPSKMAVFDLPNKFINILNLDNVNKNGTYQCTANNTFGQVTKTISVEIKPKVLWNILETPEESPIIYKYGTNIYTTRGSNTEIECKILVGKPKPQIRWFYKPELDVSFHIIKNIDEEKLHMYGVNSAHAGTYKCEAYNSIGKDFHEVNLVIGYPPTIEEGEKTVVAKKGDVITLRCIVDGAPTPYVQWFKNGTEIRGATNSSISPEDKGSYECKADNRHGTANRIISVIFYEPVTIIEEPDTYTYDLKVGENVNLCCNFGGDPIPDVHWTFTNSTTIISIPTPTSSSELILKNVNPDQHGNYTCTGSNFASSAQITFTVNVKSPPIIRRTKTTYDVVEGDLVLRIQCMVTGYPKPTITWDSEGLDLSELRPGVPTETNYEIEADGTFKYKNITDISDEIEIFCRASNSMGNDVVKYVVHVHPYPKGVPKTSTVTIFVGQSSDIKCDVPHYKDDLLRWYKGKEMIKNTELRLENASLSDAGIYTCRVSNYNGSSSKSVEVKVGIKPRFYTNMNTETQYIEMKDRSLANLSCYAEGVPKPKVKWWHNGKEIHSSDYKRVFNMSMRDIGIYQCNIFNKYGNISRTFVIQSNDCFLDIKKDFLCNQPLIQTSAAWLSYDTAKGHLRIPKGDNVRLTCPKTFTKFYSSHIDALCTGKNKFNVNSKDYKYSDLKCTLMIKPTVRQTNKKCMPGFDNTENIKVNYEVSDVTEEVYEVCLDKDNNIPIYAKYKMQRCLADVDPDNSKWSDSVLLPLDFDELYDCKLQMDSMLSLSKWFHRNYSCCFIKSQLVNPRDMVPGLAQKATFNHLNVVPQWSTYNHMNWYKLERRVRSLAKSTNHQLLVWTGTSYNVNLFNVKYSPKLIYISDKHGKKQPVPIFLWKVVQDTTTQTSLAIIQVNIPYLLKSNIRKYKLCTNICNDVDWMKIGTWDDVNQGYTYCCTIQKFEEAFQYTGVFNAEHHEVLKSVILV